MATAQDLVNQGYYGYRGWGDAAANADFNATHGAGKGGPSNSTTNSGGGNQDYGALAQQQLDLAKQANAPAVSQLQSSIPNIQQQFTTTGSNLQAQYAPLEQKYQALLSSIKGGSEQTVNQTTQGVTTGLGARGLLPSSAEGQMALSNTLNPINMQYTGLLGNAQAQNSTDVNALNSLVSQVPLQETSAEQQVQNAIAQLQAGGNSQAIQNALGLYSTQQQGALAQAQLAQTSAYNQGQLGLGSLQAMIANKNAGIAGGHLAIDQSLLPYQIAQLQLQTGNPQNDINALQGVMNQPQAVNGWNQSNQTSGWNPSSFIHP